MHLVYTRFIITSHFAIIFTHKLTVIVKYKQMLNVYVLNKNKSLLD